MDLFPLRRVASFYISPLSTSTEHVGMYQTGDMSGGKSTAAVTLGSPISVGGNC